jgi:hypothetical protein
MQKLAQQEGVRLELQCVDQQWSAGVAIWSGLRLQEACYQGEGGSALKGGGSLPHDQRSAMVMHLQCSAVCALHLLAQQMQMQINANAVA